MVYQQLFTKARMALESGVTVILDAVFHEEALRVEAQEIARSTNVPFTGLWLEAPIDVLKKRIDQRHDDASDADVPVLQLLKAPGFLDWVHVDASGSLAETIDIVSLAIDGDVAHD
jgi:predicted kinase